MSAMVVEVYDALRSVGVDEDKAKAAASALFNHDIATRGDIARLDRKIETLDKRLIRTEKDIQFMKWGISAIILMLAAEYIGGFLA